MTIAVCYVSPEGVVFGADSTSTYATADGNHYFNHGQKIYEIGENSTLGLVTWGLGGLAMVSYRTLIADMADKLAATPATSVQEVAKFWADMFWPSYSDEPIKPAIDQCKKLNKKAAYDPSAQPSPEMRTADEEESFQRLHQSLIAGFCIAGYVPNNRTPEAYQIIADPLGGKPSPIQLPVQSQMFWGAPNMIRRLVHGYDENIALDILNSGMWNGTTSDLDAILNKNMLDHPIVPIRDAIDFTYSCIYSTIKAFKFSNLSQICGGPIEIAVITTDRNFRWIRHKSMGSAITDGAKAAGENDD